MFNVMFEPGMTVVCVDAEDSTFLKKNEVYQIADVMHRGHLVKLNGITETFAASRFVPMRIIPPGSMELDNASGL